MNPLTELIRHGQSYWLDNLTRDMIMSGELERRVSEEGLRGVTSNPNIFNKAISQSHAYDDQIREAVAAGRSAPEIYEQLVIADIRSACDILRPVYDDSEGVDGYVSLEVSPHLAHDTDGSIEEARRLCKAVDRPNVFIKIPGTPAGVSAIEQLLFEGININITLLFSIQSYEAVAEAYMRALERRLETGKSVHGVVSVASFFLSRIDTLIDELLQHRISREGQNGEPRSQSLLGKAAVANAKLAYQSFKRITGGERWKQLEAKGARVQRMLWASTSTKNPAYSDVMYVEPLIGPHTVNTVPGGTITAFRDHGRVGNTVEEDVEEARRVMEDLEKLGIDFDPVAAQLLNEGIQKFIDPYDALMHSLAAKREKILRAREPEPLQEMARKLRRLVIRMTTEAGSGHPTSCMSCAEIVAAIFFREMRWDPGDPHARNVDSFILSKGHAAPILWAALSEAGAIEEDPLSLRKIDSSLEGHPTPRNPWVKVATGSLGQGLAAANGVALANRLDGHNARVYCLLGDGECSEGSVWEAAQFASLNRLENLVAIVDVNALGQTGPTPYRHDTGVFVRRFQAFGWKTIEIDGHDMVDVLDALAQAKEGRPTAIIARTEKGKGVSFTEGAEGFHGKVLSREQMEQALAELGETDIRIKVEPRRVEEYRPPKPESLRRLSLDYHFGDEVASRYAYGTALQKLGQFMPDLVVLDGDVQDSTRANFFAKDYPGRFFES